MNDRPIDGTLPIEPPLVIAGPEALRWDQRCDLLVAGFGAAGAAAAITAAEADADVRIVDRFGRGGASAISGGVVYAGGGTPQQLKAGYSDTPETMFEYLRLEVGDAVAESTLRRFCEESRDLLAWLESLGASFDSDVPPPKTSYPKDGCYLYFSGNEKVAPFAQAATPAPRGHRTVDAGLSGGRLYSYLRARVEALEIPVTAPCAVHRLITDEAGAVLGAEIRQFEPGSDAARRHARLIRRAEALHNFAGGLADRLRARRWPWSWHRPSRCACAPRAASSWPPAASSSTRGCWPSTHRTTAATCAWAPPAATAAASAWASRRAARRPACTRSRPGGSSTPAGLGTGHRGRCRRPALLQRGLVRRPTGRGDVR